MDNFQSWEFGAAADEECSKCGMKTTENSGCCRDEIKVLKLNTEAFKQAAIAYNFELPVVTAALSFYLLLPFKNATADSFYLPHGPPLISKQETYLYNCVFRI